MEIPKAEINEVEIAVVEVKIDKRRIRTAPHRWLANGKYDSKPNSPTYFKDYYRSQRQPSLQSANIATLFLLVGTVYTNMVLEAANVLN